MPATTTVAKKVETMNNKIKFSTTISRTIGGDQLRKVYAMLEDEARPYEARIATVHDRKRLVTLSLRAEDKPYFTDLFNKLKQ